jgi:pimeloyl-ACP methyl ester carboxylesterase
MSTGDEMDRRESRSRDHSRPSDPAFESGGSRWRFLGRLVSNVSILFLAASCSHASPLLQVKTKHGEIGYALHSPQKPSHHRVILAHGFLRDAGTMEHIAKALAAAGIETACISLKRSRPWAGNHAENARDMIGVREALGWDEVTYAGFSAGALSALVASSQDPACVNLVLLDPVDHGNLGFEAAPKVRVPTLAILGQPGPGNANRNASAMLASIRRCHVIEMPEATHCDFEDQPSALCHFLTGSKPDAARTAAVHESIFSQSSRFLKNQTATNP